MYLIYRGVRYTLPGSNFQNSLTTANFAQIYGDRLASVSCLVMCQYRGVSYARRIYDLTPCPSDPKLESFIAAFWEIIDA